MKKEDFYPKVHEEGSSKEVRPNKKKNGRNRLIESYLVVLFFFF